LYGVVLPLAHYQTFHAPLPHQKELDELEEAYKQLELSRAELRATMDSSKRG